MISPAGARRGARPRPLAGRDDLEEGALEALHVGAAADRDADVRGPYWPRTSDVDVAPLHRCDHVCGGYARIDHQVVGDRRRVAEAVRIEKAHQVAAALGVSALP